VKIEDLDDSQYSAWNMLHIVGEDLYNNGKNGLARAIRAADMPSAHKFWYNETSLLLYSELSNHGIPLLGIRFHWVIAELDFRVAMLSGANGYHLACSNKNRLGYLLPDHAVLQHMRYCFAVRGYTLVAQIRKRLRPGP